MAYEYESELEEEFEEEVEGEGEEELEEEVEGEGWLGAIGNIASSLLGEGEEEYEEENAFEGEEELEGELEEEVEGEGWLGAIGNIASSLLGEGEGEFESEEEISPIRRIYPDAMMEHMGELAFESESEEEAAEHFLPLIGMAASKLLPVVARAVAPMARKALPKIARAVMKSAPRLTKGVGRMARVLHRNPQTRHLLKAVPSIARRTVGSIARQAAHGRRVTPRTAGRTLARQARHVLAHPQRRRHALRRHNQLERRLHGRYARGLARPHGRRGGIRYGRYPRGHRWYGRRPRAAGVSRPGYVAPRPRAGGVYQPGYAAPRPGPGGVYQPGELAPVVQYRLRLHLPQPAVAAGE